MGVKAGRIALLDGDIIAHRAAAAAQKDIAWEEGGEASTHSDPVGAAQAAHATADAWTALADCSRAIIAFTGDDNFRRVLMPSYKSNRKGVPKPYAFAHTVSSIKGKFEHRVVRGLEADDLLGIMAGMPRYAGAVIVTIDKDLLTVPGRHLNPGQRPLKIIEVSEREADWRWMHQTLTGDSTDGYGGCPGIGKVKAGKLLGEPGAAPLRVLWPIVVKAYRDSGLTESDALLTARVARILRHEDYHKDTKEISLWHHTNPTKYQLPPT